MGASELSFMLSEETGGGIGNDAPQIDTTRNLTMYRALTAAMGEGLVRSAHDCSDGGLAVAVAECCFGCDGATTINLDALANENADEWAILFGESLGRILVSVKPEDAETFEAAMSGNAIASIGTVDNKKTLQFTLGDSTLLKANLATLLNSWKGTLNMGGGE